MRNEKVGSFCHHRRHALLTLRRIARPSHAIVERTTMPFPVPLIDSMPVLLQGCGDGPDSSLETGTNGKAVPWAPWRAEVRWPPGRPKAEEENARARLASGVGCA